MTKSSAAVVAWVLLFLSVLIPAARGAQSREAPLTNQDVRNMLMTGLSPEIVAAKIRKSSNRFDTSLDALKQLKSDNTPDVAILAMVDMAASDQPNENKEIARGTELRDFVPLFEALIWPFVLAAGVLIWSGPLSRLLEALIKRVESRAGFDLWGLVFNEMPEDEEISYEDA